MTVGLGMIWWTVFGQSDTLLIQRFDFPTVNADKLSAFTRGRVVRCRELSEWFAVLVARCASLAQETFERRLMQSDEVPAD